VVQALHLASLVLRSLTLAAAGEAVGPEVVEVMALEALEAAVLAAGWRELQIEVAVAVVEVSQLIQMAAQVVQVLSLSKFLTPTPQLSPVV
jgi:hypothetical protein